MGAMMKQTFLVMAEESVRLLMARKKTQTRRLMSPPPGFHYALEIPGERRELWMYHGQFLSLSEAAALSPVFGIVGDQLWVKETHSVEALTVYPCPLCWYKADFDTQLYDPRKEEHARGCSAMDTGIPDGCCIGCAMNGAKFRWRSPRYMSRRMSRFTLEITDVRVQRLQDITDDDAVAEGCQERFPGCWAYGQVKGPDGCMQSPRMAYANAWNRLHGGARWNLNPGPCPWDQNPWVWAISFRMVS